MNFTKKDSLHMMAKGFSLSALAAAVIISSGCSNADDPDSGTNVAKSAVTGAVVDAYLAGATVYLDSNDNGKRDAWEASAITDKDGFFSSSIDELIDYCADDATSAQARHCLKSASTGTSTLRAYGGFDVFTGEPFVGSMAAKVELLGDTVANQVVSPLTSIIAEAGDDAGAVLTELGISEDDANSDFLGEGNGTFDASLTNQALKLHKVVTLFEDVFDDHFDAFGDLSNFPARASVLIYEELADVLAAGTALDTNSLRSVFNAVNGAVLGLYNELDDDDETFPGAAAEGNVIADAVQILGLIDNAVPSDTADLAEARARMVGVELVVSKMTDDASDLADAVAAVGDLSSGLYTSIQDATDIDFATLLDTNFTSATDFDDAVIGAGGDTFDGLADKQLLLSYSDDEDGISGQALFLFDVDDSGSSGTLDLCLSYSDTSNDNTEDGDDIYETDGTLIDLADWFTIDDRRMVLSVAGSLDLTLISRGVVDGENLYSMSYAGETASWSSPTGLIDLQDSDTTAPTDDATCESTLLGLSSVD